MSTIVIPGFLTGPHSAVNPAHASRRSTPMPALMPKRGRSMGVIAVLIAIAAPAIAMAQGREASGLDLAKYEALIARVRGTPL